MITPFIFAQNIIISPNVTVSLGTATVQAQGNFSNSGILNAGHSTLNISGNWFNDGVFNADTGTVRFDGAGLQTLSGTPATFRDLIVNKSAGEVQLLANHTVNGSISVVSGDVDLFGKTLTLGSNATLAETQGNTVKGDSGVITTQRLLNAPSGLNVAGLGAVLTTATNLGMTTVTRGHAPQTYGCSQSARRYFDITPTNNTALNATLTFRYDTSETVGLTPSSFVLLKSTDIGSTWNNLGGVPDTANRTVTLAAISDLSRWTVGDPQTPAPIAIKAFLQGPYSSVSGSMGTLLNSNAYIPLSQPYNVGPWVYAGSESVSSGFFTTHSTIVDWVLMELRTTTDSTTRIARRAVFIKDDGAIVDIDGVSPVGFPALGPGTYYIVLRHRNHLAVMTPTAISVPCTLSGLTHNFTTAVTAAYGTTPMQDVGSGVYGLWAGDANSNGQVKYNGSQNDRALLYTIIGSLTGVVNGYYNEDINMNGQVKYNGSNNDRVVIYNTTGSLTGVRSTQVP